jgi:hypothetical protein
MARNGIVGGSGAAARAPAAVAAEGPDNVIVSRTADVRLCEATRIARLRWFDSAIDSQTLTVAGGLTTFYVEISCDSDS